VQDSVWNGLAVQLAPFSGSPDRWIDLLTLVVDSVLGLFCRLDDLIRQKSD
jgi:hypothetical protein